MITITGPIQTGKVGKDNILRCVDHDGVQYSLQKCMEQLRNYDEEIVKQRGKFSGVLVDTRPASHVPEECQKFLTGEYSQKLTDKLALVIGSNSIGTLIANFIAGGSFGEMRVKFFRNADDAEKWLKKN